MAKKTPPPSFEDALNELETLVDTLEKGDMSLEESLQTFERGVELTRSCQQALKDAEQKVRMLSQPDPDADLEPHDRDD